MDKSRKWTDSRKWAVMIVAAAMAFLVAAALGWWPLALAVLMISGRMLASIGMLCFIAWATNRKVFAATSNTGAERASGRPRFKCSDGKPATARATATAAQQPTANGCLTFKFTGVRRNGATTT
jgi:hypothetical protein